MLLGGLTSRSLEEISLLNISYLLSQNSSFMIMRKLCSDGENSRKAHKSSLDTEKGCCYIYVIA